MLDVLEERADSIQVETFDEESDSIEFEVRVKGKAIGHQVKRQHGTDANWTPKRLASEGVLSSALSNHQASREYVFVSTIPARELDELTALARASDSPEAFAQALSKRAKSLRDDRAWLVQTWGIDEAEAWSVLNNFQVEKPSEEQLRRSNESIAGYLIDGPGATTTEVLVAVAKENLGSPLTAHQIWVELEKRGLKPVPTQDRELLAVRVGAATERWRRSHGHQLDPPLERAVAAEICEAAKTTKIVLVAGEAGTGKSVALGQATDLLAVDGWPVLAMRLDLATAATSTRQLGEQLDLPLSAAIALAQVAQGGPAALVIDQLDAVSLTSGRLGDLFLVVDELIHEAKAFPELRVILACRRFDLQSDERFRRLAAREDAARLDVPPLSADEVAEAVGSMGLNPKDLSAEQREVLTNPLALVLLQSIADEENLDFRSLTQLFDRYWTRKQLDADKRRPGVRFERVIGRVAEAISSSQRLEVPIQTLEGEDLALDAATLVSEHVLVRDGDKIGFFHEAFFDYAFARGFLSSGVTVRQFLLEGEQELFRRAQVRQILFHLRQVDPGQFVDQVDDLLAATDVRFHIKRVVLAVLRALADPSAAEWQLVRGLLDETPEWRDQLWLALRTPGWFDRLVEEGEILDWLHGEDASRAIEILASVVDQRPTKVAEILASVRDTGDYPSWFRWVARWAPFDASRELFEQLVASVADGLWRQHEEALWSSVYTLPDEQPDWAIELVLAWLNERKDEGATDAFGGGLEALKASDQGLLELTHKAAEARPASFLEAILPWVIDLVDGARSDAALPAINPHLSPPSYGNDVYEIGEALVAALAQSLQSVCASSPESIRPLLEKLADSDSIVSQYLLYKALAASPELADWAADLLIEGEHRFYDGDHSTWGTRELLAATSPEMSDERYKAVEKAILNFDPDDERRPDYRRWRGMGRLTLLQGLAQNRLTPEARRERGELERKIGNVVPRPRGITSGWVTSPIAGEKTKLMSDEQWLSAIHEYESDEHSDDFLKGGAMQLSQELEERSKEDPTRFANLGAQLTADDNPSYLSAILRGVGSAEGQAEPEAVFGLVRHAAAMESAEIDRWLGWPFRSLLAEAVPSDLIELLVQRAQGSEDPDADRKGDLDLLMVGMNSVRGSLSGTLADLLAADPSDERRDLIRPAAAVLAADPSLAVRAMAARLLHAYLATEPELVLEHLPTLLEDPILETTTLERLIGGLTIKHSEETIPIVKRMLESQSAEVRKVGGRLAAWMSSIEVNDSVLREVMDGSDPAGRTGAADLMAARIGLIADRNQAVADLIALLNDTDGAVRAAAARFPIALREEELVPWTKLIEEAVSSPAFDELLAQLLITLEQAKDEVGPLTLIVAERFVEANENAIGDISTRAAAHARSLGELILRAARESHDVETTRRVLDTVDLFLSRGAYDFADALDRETR
jgi:hypothetical protein